MYSVVVVGIPPKKYTNLSISQRTREELDRLREETGISSLDDLLILLVRTYREYTNIVSKVEEIVTNTISKALREALNPHTNTISKDSNPANIANNPTTKPPKKEAGKPPSSNVWCKKKSEIRSTKGYVDALRARGVKLKDWWEEEDQYCFETE